MSVTRLELGGGATHQEGFTSIDLMPYTDNTIVHNLENGLPDSIKDNSVVEIHADNFLEHIQNVVDVMNDCHRVITDDGLFVIKVPKAGTVADFKDPTHKTHFLKETFQYFDIDVAEEDRQPDYGQKKWRIISLEEVDVGRGSEEGTGNYVQIEAVLQKA